jgi:hypothetical protein
MTNVRIVTGTEIANLRLCLGLSVQQFAALCGVTPASVYRWESSPDRNLSVDPFQTSVLGALETECVRRRPPRAQRDWGRTLAGAIAVGGSILAIGALAQALFGSRASTRGKPARRRKPCRRNPVR